MRFEKLAALGAVAVSGGLVLLYGLFWWLGTRHPETGGVDLTHGTLIRLTLGIAIGAVIALHLALAHQLWHAPVPATTDPSA